MTLRFRKLACLDSRDRAVEYLIGWFGRWVNQFVEERLVVPDRRLDSEKRTSIPYIVQRIYSANSFFAPISGRKAILRQFSSRYPAAL